MNATIHTHPAESPEFLSRLHDGELDAAEAASFEEHRRTCPRCREAADSYARALRIFRSASPRPAASDLSARILRKVRAQAPSRRPFGVTFGIDVRWAGVCAAALIVVIMAASILDEGPVPSIVLAPPPAAEPESVRARLLEKANEEGPPAKGDRRAGRKTAPAPPVSSPPSRAPGGGPEEPGPRDQFAAAAPPVVVRENAQPPASAERSFAPAPPAAPGSGRDENAPVRTDAEIAQKRAATSRDESKLETRSDAAKADGLAAAAPRTRITASADAQGGEAGAAAPAPSEADAPAAVRLLVRPADGFGGAPAIERDGDSDALAALRGREFVLVVESGGRVRSAALSGDGLGLPGLRQKDKAAEREDLSALLALRFAPGDRPRRLILRIE